jgi:multidrug efflux pump
MLKPFGERTRSAEAINAELGAKFAQIEGGFAYALMPPPIQGLGNGSGYSLFLQDRAGLGYAALQQALEAFQAEIAKTPGMTYPVSSYQSNIPQLEVKVDRIKAKAQGVALTDLFQTLQAYLGSVYVNDFNAFGRVWRVMLQADADRQAVEDIAQLRTRNARGEMVPIGSMVTVVPSFGPDPVLRYNGFPAADLIGDSDPRLLSSAEVLTKLQEIAQRTLPRGIELAWTDLSYQQVEQSNAAAVVFVIAVMLVFLVLAALYELDPAAGRDPDRARVHLRGAVRRVAGRRRQQRLRAGGPGGADGPGLQERDPDRGVRTRAGDARLAIVDAALQACRLRLRPIVMTSIAFIAGAVPLLIGGGAGSEVRAATGVTVFSGMLGVTLFGLFLTPVFYVTLRRLSGRSLASMRLHAAPAPHPPTKHPWRATMSEIRKPCAGMRWRWRLPACWPAAPSAPISGARGPPAGAVRAGRACTGHPAGRARCRVLAPVPGCATDAAGRAGAGGNQDLRWRWRGWTAPRRC